MSAMIVAPQPVAVEEGAKVLASGGNAFDAALACACVQFVIDPHSCGVGGYLIMNYKLARHDDPAPIVDAPAIAGSKVRPDMWSNVVLGPNPSGWGFYLQHRENDEGYQSICTPGMIRGMEFIHKRWCTRQWADLLAPAIRLAEEGWIVGGYPADRWKSRASRAEESSLFDKLHVTPEARKIYLKHDGAAYDAGDRITNSDYANTLRRLAEHGADDLYIGKLAEEIAGDLNAHGSWVTAQDLADYGVREEPPVVTSYRGWTIQTSQPPHGGPTLAAILNVLEGYDLAALGHNSPAYIHLVSMAMKAAFADRNRWLGDPRFVEVPLAEMISKERGAKWRKTIDSGAPIEVPRIQPGSKSTTQVTVVDHEGNCVSLTHSLGSSSGVITSGLGFMYNNSMVNFYPYPGHPNSIFPGKGRTTGMTPTLVLRDGKPVMVLGAPGATRIITAVLQTILNHLDFGMSITEAVLAPRFDCQGDVITCHARIPESVCAEVRKKHPISRLPYSHGELALVHAIAIESDKGLRGAADAGADGMAILVPDREGR
jgi:gamma-glutamyltranspeptidase/glutathione hydrolase